MNDEGEEWLLRPVAEGMCRYESLKDGTLGLNDIARMNDYLDVRAENRARIEDAVAAEHRRG
jgi:hypothetical protein